MTTDTEQARQNLRRNRIKRLFMVLLCSAAAWSLFAYVRFDLNRLSRLSTNVCKLPKGASRDERYCAWETDTTFVLFQNDLYTLRLELIPRAYRVDITRGTTTEVGTLEQAIKVFDFYKPALSRDRSYYLITRHNRREYIYPRENQYLSDYYVTMAMDLQGNPLRTWTSAPREYNYPFLSIGLSAKNGWMEFHPGQRNHGYTMMEAVRHPIVGADGPDTESGILQQDMLLGVSKSNEFITYNRSTGFGKTNLISGYRLEDLKKPVFELQLPIEDGRSNEYNSRLIRTPDSIELSPSGDRLMFVVSTGGEPKYPKLLRQLFKSLANATMPIRSELWVCDVDCKNAHLLAAPDMQIERKSAVWRPDGKSISFIANGDLRVLPVQ